jgi:hypothetical protein
MAKRQVATSAWIDVYIWTADLDKFEVGHAMAIAHRNPSKIYLNEFPSDPGIPKSLKASPMNLQQTIAHYKGRQPSSILPYWFRIISGLIVLPPITAPEDIGTPTPGAHPMRQIAAMQFIPHY